MDEQRDQSGRTDLHYAAFENDVARLRELIDSGAAVNAVDHDGLTPLHFAAHEGAVEAAALLLERGADVGLADRHGNTPLFKAVFNSRGEGSLIKLLRAAGADPLRVNKSGQTPTGLARLIGNYDVARFFADVAK